MVPATEELGAERRERRSPGLAALFGSLVDDGRHSVLDFGSASGPRLRVLRPFARQVRFTGLLTTAAPDVAWDGALRALPPNPSRPYDVVLLWDVLDRLDAERRARLVSHLDELTAARARLYAVAGAEGDARARMLAFELVARDRVAERTVGVTGPGTQALLPAQMQRVLEPFEVVSAFMLRSGAREYVAIKRL